MTAKEALARLVKASLVTHKAQRFTALLETKKGARKFLAELSHGFDAALDSNCIGKSKAVVPMTSPCFSFSGSKDFGGE